MLVLLSDTCIKPKSRATCRTKAKEQKEIPKNVIVSNPTVTVTPVASVDNQRLVEMDLLALTRLLDSKQRSFSSLVQMSATDTSAALAMTRGTYDENHFMWKRVINTAVLMEKQRQEIQEIEAAILGRHTNRKRKIDSNNDDESVTILETPATLLPKTSTSSLDTSDMDVNQAGTVINLDENTTIVDTPAPFLPITSLTTLENQIGPVINLEYRTPKNGTIE